MSKVERSGEENIKQLLVTLNSLDRINLKVGWFEGAKYEDGTPVAYVAAIQEYGFVNIPPRSFMRTTVQEKKEAWKKLQYFQGLLILSQRDMKI